jgi:NADH-quinone oxidoreductase subunit E
MALCHSVLIEKKYQELNKYIDSILENEQQKDSRSKLIQVLHHAQGIFGYLPVEVQEWIAGKLSISAAEVFGVVSFYSYFTMKPRGKYKISVCTGTACYVKGAESLLETLEDELGLKPGETSADMRFSLDILRCIGACGIAPVMLVNDKAYGNLTPDQTRIIIKKYSGEER